MNAPVATIAAAVACCAAVGVGLGLTVPLLSLEMERMGASGTLIGVNTAVAGVASILIVPFVPRIAARVGLLRLIVVAIVVSAASILAFRLFFGIAWWFPLRFVFSAALGTLFVLSEYWIGVAAPPARRGLVMGVYATVLAAGFAAGPVLLSIVGTSGWPPYAWGAGLVAAAALPLLAARGLTPEVESGGGRGYLGFLRAAPAATCAALVYGAAETGGFALLPVYGLQFGRSAEQSAVLVSVLTLGNVVFQIPLGLLSDRVDRSRVLLFCGVAGVAGGLVLPFTVRDETLLYATLFVWGGLIGGLYTVGLAQLASRFAGADLPRANAAFVVLYNVGLTAGPPFIGAGMDLSPAYGFAWTLALLFCAYVVVVALDLRARRP